MTATQIAGVLPAIVFPTATAIQLLRILRARSAIGVSAVTWTLFGLGNLALYYYTERYAEWQSILGILVTAILDLAIAALAVIGYRRRAA